MKSLCIVVCLYFINKLTAELFADMSGYGVFIVDSKKDFVHSKLFRNKQTLLQYFFPVALALF